MLGYEREHELDLAVVVKMAEGGVRREFYERTNRLTERFRTPRK